MWARVTASIVAPHEYLFLGLQHDNAEASFKEVNLWWSDYENCGVFLTTTGPSLHQVYWTIFSIRTFQLKIYYIVLVYMSDKIRAVINF